MAEPFADGEVVAGTTLNNLAWGVVAYAVGSASVTGITAQTDVPGASIAWTMAANRVIVVRAWALISQVTAGAQIELALTSSANAQAVGTRFVFAAGEQGTLFVEEFILTGGGGANTRKLRVGTGAGTCNVEGVDGRYVARIIAYDVGGY